jgi:hypothetical protein
VSATPRPTSPVLSLVRRREDHEPPEAPATPLPADRYTVLLLDEAQLDRLLHRQSLRPPAVEDDAPPVLISPPAQRPVAAPRIRVPSWAARVAALMAAVLLIVGVAWWVQGGSQPASVPEETVAVAPAPVEDPAPVVSTGASLSVDVAATGIDDQARQASRRLAEAGWPAFTWRVDPDRRHVLVGPYSSIDEAEATQRALARAGYPGARVHVDDRLRVAAAALSATRRPRQNPDIVLVAAPGRLSFVFELVEEPRHVSGQRVSATTFTVTAGPLRTPVEEQTWKAPGDVSLVKRVSLARPGADAGTMQATVTLAENADASVRLQGRRVYVDVFRRTDDPLPLVEELLQPVAPQPRARASFGLRTAPPAAAAPRSPMPAGAAAPPASAPAVTPARSSEGMDAYRAALQPLLARFEEVQPFLGATIATASPDILAALNGTCVQLEQAAAAITPPPSARGVHNLLTSAAHLARTATGPAFSGDRLAQVKEAGAQFAAAKLRLAELGR